MQITSIRLKKINSKKQSLLGIASIELDNSLVIHGIKLIQLKDKRIISFPNRKIRKCNYDSEGAMFLDWEYADVVHPSTKELREYIETELFKMYDSEEVDGDE